MGKPEKLTNSITSLTLTSNYVYKYKKNIFCILCRLLWEVFECMYVYVSYKLAPNYGTFHTVNV